MVEILYNVDNNILTCSLIISNIYIHSPRSICCWGCSFESRREHGCLLRVFYVVR